MVEYYKIILEGRKIRSETYFYLFQPCETHCQFSFVPVCLPALFSHFDAFAHRTLGILYYYYTKQEQWSSTSGSPFIRNNVINIASQRETLPA